MVEQFNGVIFSPDRPLVPWKRKFAIVSIKLAITRLVSEICPPRFLYQTGSFQIIQVYPTPIAMVTKSWEFQHEVGYYTARMRENCNILEPTVDIPGFRI